MVCGIPRAVGAGWDAPASHYYPFPALANDCGIVSFAKPLAPRNLLAGGHYRRIGDAMPSTTTPVEIFGEVYHVRGSDENGHLKDLAGLVDSRMREVAQQVKGDTAWIAILAALNLADELFQIQSQQEGERVEIREKVAALTEELTQALDG